jgi:FKBP-type peptidyl-prolyl cis-trans isomerase FkpA
VLSARFVVRPWTIAAAAALCAVLAGCSKTPTSPSTVTTLTKTDLVVGTGDVATSGQVLTVNYTGWFYDPNKSDFKGLQFDTSVGRGPFSFTLGQGQVIEGWDQGLPGMKVGGLRRLIIPASLAYGVTRSGPIPANATLLFEVELVSVAAPGS